MEPKTTNNSVKYRFTDLVDVSTIEQLLNSFYIMTGIQYAVLDTHNEILAKNGWQDICTRFHRICPQTEARCRQSDSYIFDRIHDGPYVGYKCLNGLMEYASPIIVEGEHLATLFMGQLLHEPPDEEFFRQQAKDFGFNELAYIEALHRVPVVSQDKIKQVMEFYSQVAQTVASLGLERKRKLAQMERTLKESEEKFAKSFHFSPDPIAISTVAEGRYTEVNEAWSEYIGFKRDEVIGRTSIELGIWTSLQDREIMLEEIREYGRICNRETSFRSKSGEIRTYLISGEILEIAGESHLLITARDIEERKRMEAALSLSEERFAKAFNVSPMMMMISSLNDGKFIDINDRFCHNCYYERKEILGLTPLEIGLWSETVDHMIAESIIGKDLVRDIEIPFCRQDGEERLGLYSCVRSDINNEPCLISMIKDITESKKMEVEISRLDRLELVGEMAASIGHEIRNPLTTVRGFLQILEEKYSGDKASLDLMIEELDRANSIITEFLSLARDKLVELKPANLNAIILKLFPLIKAKAMMEDKNIACELNNLPGLLLDEKEISQLIHNMVNNGLESMDYGGCVTIRTFVEGDSVVLSIEDQGQGIPPEFLDKLGTPFFTTKEYGTGLGLAICYGIAKRHNARIGIETGSNGTSVNVRFLPINDNIKTTGALHDK